MDFRIAVKAFVVNDNNELLVIKRRPNDVHKPGAWDIPGGRLELGEDPYEGLKREVLEEVGLKIAVIHPLDVHHFVRQDGQKITMIIFLCRSENDNIIKLSEEHTEYAWVDTHDTNDSRFPKWLENPAENYRNHFMK